MSRKSVLNKFGRRILWVLTLSLGPKGRNPNLIFQVGDGFGFLLFTEDRDEDAPVVSRIGPVDKVARRSFLW